MSVLNELEVAAIRGGIDERVLNRARAERDAEVERAVQAEREACAKIIEDATKIDASWNVQDICRASAAAIRARGEKGK